MGTISTLAVGASYEALTDDISYTLVRCEARPLTAGLAPPLAAALLDITAHAETERTLVLEVARAEVMVSLADQDIDSTVDAIVNAILTITGGDRTHEIYTFYVKDTTPGDLKSPVLAEELETVRQWVPSLQASPHPTLVALAPVLGAQVGAADASKAALDAATLTLTIFREQGGKKTLVDALNATRKSTHGALGVIAHSNPQLLLPINFADRFFRHEPQKRRVSRKELQTRLDAAKELVVELTAKLAKADGDAATAAQKAAAQKAKDHQQKLAAAQRKAEEAAAELAALQQGP